MLKKVKEKTYDDYFRWVGTESSGLPWVRIRGLVWGGSGWAQVCENRSRLCRRVYEGWALSPPRFGWDDDKWNDWNSWRRILGDRRKWFRPNVVIEIGYGDNFSGQFFLEGFRFAPIGMTDQACAERIGSFMVLVFGKLPAPGEHSDVIMIKDPYSEENQIFWLGVILQGSRMVLG
jgi:hypothetical protein